MAVISMSFLLEAGVHFGHQTKRWNPKMKEYIFTARDDIYIIDLQKTLKKIEETYKVLKEIAQNDGKVLFVGTKKQAQEAAKEEAIRSGMYYVTERWLGGTLTNFRTIRKRINRLSEIENMEKDGTFNLLPKKEVVKLRKEYDKLNRNLVGIRDMKRLPGALIIVDPRKEINAIKEARKLNIPVIGIVDTNCDPDDVDYVIPANDDAIRAVKLVLGVLANAIVEANGGEMIDFLNEEDKVIDNNQEKEEPLKDNQSKNIVEKAEKNKEQIKDEKPKEEQVEKSKKEVKTKKEQKETTEKDLSKLTLVELKKLAKNKGISGYSKLKKAELISILK